MVFATLSNAMATLRSIPWYPSPAPLAPRAFGLTPCRTNAIPAPWSGWSSGSPGRNSNRVTNPVTSCGAVVNTLPAVSAALPVSRTHGYVRTADPFAATSGESSNPRPKWTPTADGSSTTRNLATPVAAPFDTRRVTGPAPASGAQYSPDEALMPPGPSTVTRPDPPPNGIGSPNWSSPSTATARVAPFNTTGASGA